MCSRYGFGHPFYGDAEVLREIHVCCSGLRAAILADRRPSTRSLIVCTEDDGTLVELYANQGETPACFLTVGHAL